MPVYMIDLGNSNDGPIGLVARVHAPTKDVAIARFHEIPPRIEERFDGFDYCSVYLNFNHVTLDNIIDDETEDCFDETQSVCTFCGKAVAA